MFKVIYLLTHFLFFFFKRQSLAATFFFFRLEWRVERVEGKEK